MLRVIRDSWIRVSLAVVGAALLSPVALADSWAPPSAAVYYSADKAWRFTVTPRSLSSPLAYFEDKTAGRPDAGKAPGDPRRRAWGVMQHLDHGQWHITWTGPLLNEVSPVTVIVSPSGQAVTFDNWSSVGYGKNAVVIYDGHGHAVRAMGLNDFLPPEYIEALPHSVSSIWWGNGHHFSASGKELILRVVVPAKDRAGSSGDADSPHIDLRFDLATGRELPPDAKAWSAAMASAERVVAVQRAEKAKWEAAFRAPLLAPHSDAVVDWHQYLREAFERIDPDWKDTFPATKVLPLPASKDYPLLLRYLKEAFHEDRFRYGVLMIASPSQDNLVRQLKRIVAKVPQGWFKKARIYVAVDDAHTAVVAKLLAPTGAHYVQLNPDKPIPQRNARLDDQSVSSKQ